MRHYSNIKARYEWRVLQDHKGRGEVLTNPDTLILIGNDREIIQPEPLNQNHLGQTFFTDRDLAYQKLDQWMTTHECNAKFVLIEIVDRKTR